MAYKITDECISCGACAAVCPAECIAEGVSQSAYHTCAQHGDNFSQAGLVFVLENNLAGQMGDGPEKEKNSQGAENGRHGVDAHGYHFGARGKMCKHASGEHEEGCAWRVSDIEFEGGCNKLTAVPETGCRFDGHQIGDGCNSKGYPSKNVVVQFKLFHYDGICFIIKLKTCKDNKFNLYFCAPIKEMH